MKLQDEVEFTSDYGVRLVQCELGFTSEWTQDWYNVNLDSLQTMDQTGIM